MDIEAIKREMERLLAEDFPVDTAAAVSGGKQDVAALPHYGRIQGADVVSHLEHSLLNPDTTVETIMRECALARRLSVAAVCVAPYYVPAAKVALSGSTVALGTAVGFPHGCMSAAAKMAELRECMANGAQEIDVALNNLALKSHQIDVARQELDEMLELTKGRVLVKAVFEHSIFDEDEKEAVLKMLKSSGVTLIKIQNMLSGHGARVEDVQYAAGILGRHIAIKIDGGIKTLQQAQDLLAAGASRLGLTATAKIAAEAGIH